jgi:hypothetical protein
MPLKSGKKNVSSNIKELDKGPHHAKMAAKHGEKKAHEIDVAIAMSKAKEKTGYSHMSEHMKGGR